jgi:hypothetical protein
VVTYACEKCKFALFIDSPLYVIEKITADWIRIIFLPLSSEYKHKNWKTVILAVL